MTSLERPWPCILLGRISENLQGFPPWGLPHLSPLKESKFGFTPPHLLLLIPLNHKDEVEAGDALLSRRRREPEARNTSPRDFSFLSFLESRLGHEGAGVIGVCVLTPPDLTQFFSSNTAGS